MTTPAYRNIGSITINPIPMANRNPRSGYIMSKPIRTMKNPKASSVKTRSFGKKTNSEPSLF
jgi:hypothetical protein